MLENVSIGKGLVGGDDVGRNFGLHWRLIRLQGLMGL